jgi:glutamate/tyrosine decarboxylase-like PLP-dependent enzyme
MAPEDSAASGITLDPEDWPAARAQAHTMLDDMLDYIAQIRERPVWQPIPDVARSAFRKNLPHESQALESVHAEFMENILPYATGNVHPGFMGWVHGGGTVNGMLAEMLAAGLNANLGGRDHIPIEVERQIVEWVREMFGFPAGASGLFVTGTSMANLLAVLIARTAKLGADVRNTGLRGAPALRAYTSTAAHGCITRALDLSGLGGGALRLVPTNGAFRMDNDALRAAIRQDRAAGLTPFMIVATAGTVDAGAIDDLAALADIAREEKLWFHIDGAYGALGVLSPEIAPRLRGLEKADSVAFDFHKWGQVPYDAGFLLVRDGRQHRETFAAPAAYLQRETRGLAAGEVWPCDLGPDLSRGFRALKTWFTFKTYGADRIGQVIARSCRLAKYLEDRIRSEPELELLAPAQLNIVCFRYRSENSGPVNAAIIVDLQESGIAAPSSTSINGVLAIRAALVNHRTQACDIDALIAATLHFGRQHQGKAAGSPEQG